jgi:HEAT repeat protein
MSPDEQPEQLLADLSSGDEQRAEAAALRLAEMGDGVLAPLEKLLGSEVADRRWWAIRTIGQMPSPRIDLLVRALQDPSNDVRAGAALALATHPAEQAAPALVKALDDQDSIVGVLAVDALISIGKAAAPALIEAYPALRPRGKVQAMRALADMRDHRAIPLMMKAIEEESALMRFWAEQGLERLGLNMVYIKPE